MLAWINIQLELKKMGRGLTPSKTAKTRADLLRETLAEDIVFGRLPPGARLDEQELADRFQVSRTPVREALKQLSATGLIEMRPHRGVVVAMITVQRLAELFEALAEMEALCARLSAEKMSPAERRDLEALHGECRDTVASGAAIQYHRANQQFHAAIHQGTHNSFLAEATATLRNRLALYSHAQFQTVDGRSRSYAEHEEIVSAILRGDAMTAEREMRRHVLTVQGTIEAFVRKTQTKRADA